MPPADESHQGPGARGHGSSPSATQLERWTRVKALFLEALQYPESDRSGFVAQAAAGDLDLREELDSLLRSEEAAASFCETPAAELLGSGHLREPETAPRLPPGARLGAYEITGFIAAGGMGAVYRARHSVLGREVAIKTIAVGLADDAAKRRLIREAQHASVLAHPNICAIHDVGEAAAIPFIVMTYVPGRTLHHMIGESALSIREALEYGVQIAGALEHAHARGIIHRDLKSSNIVIDENGQAIVLDFGLARRLPKDAELQSRDPTLTRPDALAGTLSHMAPEVLRGERADTLSDIWALGVLLYELVTGEMPFTGRTPFETSSAILGEEPRSMGAHVPVALRLVIGRCLNKNPPQRYQRAQSVADALDAIRRRRAWPMVGRLLVSARRRTLYSVAAAAVVLAVLLIAGDRLRSALGAMLSDQISTVAVLPLENATADPGADYYAEGMTDAIISQLGATSNARVLSRASTSRAARTAKTVSAIGAQLGADAVAQAKFRRVANEIRIDVRLLRPADDRVLWSETYQRTASEVLALEADVVRGLANAIDHTLRPDARKRLASVRAVSPAVYEAYLKGRYEWNLRTPQSLQSAIDHFNRAVALDPTYAPAHAALADCFNQLGTVMVGTGSPREYRPRAEREAIAALQIDPQSAEAHAALGYVWHYEWRWVDAEKEFRRAIELNPNYPLVRIWYANLLMSRLRLKEALEQATIARDLDPFSLIVNTNLAWVLTNSGRQEDAIAQLQRTLGLDSTYIQARFRLAAALLMAGRLSEALDQAHRLVAFSDSSPPMLAMLAIIDARAGRRREAKALLDELLARSRREYVPSASLASVYNALGGVDSAMIWLDKAFAEQSNAIAYLAVDYQRNPMAADPRFQTLLTRAGLK